MKYKIEIFAILLVCGVTSFAEKATGYPIYSRGSPMANPVSVSLTIRSTAGDTAITDTTTMEHDSLVWRWTLPTKWDTILTSAFWQFVCAGDTDTVYWIYETQPEKDTVKANIVAISDDTIPAEHLEAMLDGTGGVDLKLRMLLIQCASDSPGILIQNSSPNGVGIEIYGGETGIYSVGRVGAAFYGDGGTNSAGIIAAADSGIGLYAFSGDSDSGIVADGVYSYIHGGIDSTKKGNWLTKADTTSCQAKGFALKTTADSILVETLTHPTLAEMLSGGIARRDTLTAVHTAISLIPINPLITPNLSVYIEAIDDTLHRRHSISPTDSSWGRSAKKP